MRAQSALEEVAVARQPDVIVDDSPLDSPSIDVRLRIGWLLRTCRLNSDVPSARKGDTFALELGVGPAPVTKWEKGREDIHAAAVEGYERVLGMSPGSLRGVIEITRRTFRHPTPDSLRPAARVVDLEQVTEMLRPAMAGTARGIDWLHFADHLHEGAPKVPAFLVVPAFDRLASELSRSIEDAYLTRYEAMARLRTGPYGKVALGSLLHLALADDTQVAIDLLDVASEQPTLELFDRMLVLLRDPRLPVFEGACQALVTMAALGGITPRQMCGAVDRLVHAYNGLADDPARHPQMSLVFRNLPSGVMAAARTRLRRPLVELEMLPAHGSRSGQAFRAAAAIAGAVKPGKVYTDEVLDRVVFEAMFDRVWTKRYLARFFLRALPFRVEVAAAAAALADTTDNPIVERAAAHLALSFGGPDALGLGAQWALSDDDEERAAGLIALGHAGTDLDAELLEKTLERPWPIARRAVYAAGMSASPVLQSWADDEKRPDDVRRAARWWLAQGSRITDRW